MSTGERGPELGHWRKLKITPSSFSVLLKLDLQLSSKLHNKNKAEFCCHSSSWAPLSMRTNRMTKQSRKVSQEMSRLFCPPTFSARPMPVRCVYWVWSAKRERFQGIFIPLHLTSVQKIKDCFLSNWRPLYNLPLLVKMWNEVFILW